MTEPQETNKACDDSLTRQEFIRLLLQRAAVTGAILSAPKVIDKFLIPPVYAASSSPIGGHDTAPGQDTTVNADAG